jgi:hypothetical protein
MTLSQSNRSLLALVIVLTGLIGYSFTGAQTWTAPGGTPPASNVETPINVGSDLQTKSGSLSILGSLGVNTINISNGAPTIRYADTDHIDWWTHVNEDKFYFLNDRNNDDSWDWPYPLYMQSGLDPASDFARFANQVRAVSYCDENGGNCITAANIQSKGGGGDIDTNYVTARQQLRSNQHCDVNGGSCFAPSDVVKKSASCSWTGFIGQWGGGNDLYCPNNGSVRGIGIEDNFKDVAAVRLYCCS